MSHVTIVLNNTDKKVLSLLKEKPEQTREEIAFKIGKTARTLQRSLDKLKEYLIKINMILDMNVIDEIINVVNHFVICLQELV